MNKNQFYKEVGLIDNDLIMEAEVIQKTTFHHVLWKGGTLAACLVIMILSSVFLLRPMNKNRLFPELDSELKQPKTPSSTIPSEYPSIEQNSLIFNDASNQIARNLDIPGHFWQTLIDRELAAVLPGLGDGYELTATANFMGDGKLFNIDAHAKTKLGVEFYIQLASNEPVSDYSFPVTPIESRINNTSVLAGVFNGSNGHTYFANFKLDDVGYYIELTVFNNSVTDENAKEIFNTTVYHIISGGAADLSVLNPIIPELRDDHLTLEEAYNESDFGAYLPQKLPSGFSFESSQRFMNQRSNYLSALWHKGLDDINWMVSNFSESDRARITAVADTKNYDLSLYPIPRADSVPKELREIVDDPIFLIDELTLEAVWMRTYTINDKGDSDGYRMHFSVLYDNDILVQVSVKGVDPTYIFEELIGMNAN